jgi:hypothetical protein
MREPIEVDSDLLRRARRHAARTGRTLTEVVEDALRAAVAGPHDDIGDGPVNVPTSPGALRPGVELESNAQVLDRMEFED